jgi:hypothetical protein
VLRAEVENAVALASAQEDAEGLILKVALLEVELALACRAQEVADVAADGARQLVVFERECQKQFDELSLLQACGSKLCLAIVGLPSVRNYLSERMRVAALRHTKMAGEVAMLQVVVSSSMESVLGSLPDETFWVEVVGELVAKFRRLEGLCSQLERPGATICNRLLGLPLGQAQWAGRLNMAARWLGVDLAARREVDAELEALRTSAGRVRDLVLDNIDGSSSLAASLSMVVELLECRIDIAATNEVR